MHNGKIRKRVMAIFIVGLLISSMCGTTVKAEETSKDNQNVYYYDNVVNTGHDTGYKKRNAIDSKDPHYNWKLGQMVISGFTSQTKDSDGKIVFLKTVGDTVSFTFHLEQDINKLNDNKNLRIASDKNGWDEGFQVDKQAFKKGALIVRKTDYQNKQSEPVVYDDYLNGVNKGANTKIEIFEEGDYEVALDYELIDDGFAFFDQYHNYSIRFNFSIRNGNCMVFPMDAVTKQELTNASITENGFYLDLARSRYLDINVKKEVMSEGATGLVEDTRFNKPAKDGDMYTEEGIYTITAKNAQTGESTVKKIYVGTNSVMKAHMLTGYTISDINSLVSKGAIIDSEGKITILENVENPEIPIEEKKTNEDTSSSFDINKYIPIGAVVVVLIVMILVFIGRNKGKRRKNAEEVNDDKTQKNE